MSALVQLASWLLTPFEAMASAAALAAWIVVGFAVQWWYGALCEWRWGSTLGKWLLRIRVVDAAGLPPSLLQAVARNLLRLVDLLPGLHLMGALVCLIDPHGRRLGDLAAQTLVVRDAPPRPTQRVAPPSTPASPHAEKLALLLRPSEKRLVAMLVGKLDDLPVPQRIRLCTELADCLLNRYAVEPPAGLSGERTLRLVAAALQAH